jgi:ATP:ADP antiporter, AAA family
LLVRVARVRPDERRAAAGAFLTLFAFMAGHAMLETARDALFLASLPASQLPWVYLAIAVVALALTQRQTGILDHVSTRNELSAWMLLASVVTLALWVLIAWAGRWIFYVLYVWSGVLATLVVVRFWTVLAGLFTVTQAKRLFATIGTGSVVGAIVGSGVARILTGALPAQHVVFAAALIFLAGSAAPRLLERDGSDELSVRRRADAPTDLHRITQIIWERPYLRRVAAMILAATVTFTLIDFVFKSTAARFVPDEALGEFFATVYFVLNLLSLVVQVGLVSLLLRRMGVSAALAIAPALLSGTAILSAAGGGLALAVLLRGADGMFRHSIYRTGTELLFVPLAVETRNRVKAFIDVTGQRGGQALASLLILVGLTLTQRENAFALVAAITSGVWLYLTLDLKAHYLNVFRETLMGEGGVGGTVGVGPTAAGTGMGVAPATIGLPLLDMASLESLLSTLNDPDDAKVVAALDILVAQGKTRVIPALILYHPSPEVVIHALTLFEASGRVDWLPMVDRLLGHPDPSVRSASLRAQSVVRPNRESLDRASGDAVPSVRATALVALVAGGWAEWDDVAEEIQGMVHGDAVDGEGESASLAVARAIRHQPAPMFASIPPLLASSSSTAVRVEAIRAMGAIGGSQYVTRLIPMLAERVVREDVRAALVAIGPAALTHLEAALVDARLVHAVRRHVPGSIARFASTGAADVLVKHLLTEQDGMIRFKIIRSLGQMRRRQPGLPLDRKRLQRAVQQTLSTASKFMWWKRAVTRRAGVGDAFEDLSVGLLIDKQYHAVERLFRLLNLESNNDDFWHIYRGLTSDRKIHRASSRELLEHLVFPPLREPLLKVLDDTFDEGTTSGQWFDDDMEYEAVLHQLIDSGLESVSSVTARMIAAQRRMALRGAVEGCVALSADHRHVLDRVLRDLSPDLSGGLADGA